VDSDGTLKLADFGLSILHDAAMQFSLTDPGGGTFRWMARNIRLSLKSQANSPL
jgi:hypothetical protein